MLKTCLESLSVFWFSVHHAKPTTCFGLRSEQQILYRYIHTNLYRRDRDLIFHLCNDKFLTYLTVSLNFGLVFFGWPTSSVSHLTQCTLIFPVGKFLFSCHICFLYYRLYLRLFCICFPTIQKCTWVPKPRYGAHAQNALHFHHAHSKPNERCMRMCDTVKSLSTFTWTDIDSKRKI